jgi:hypothetical protein
MPEWNVRRHGFIVGTWDPVTSTEWLIITKHRYHWNHSRPTSSVQTACCQISPHFAHCTAPLISPTANSSLGKVVNTDTDFFPLLRALKTPENSDVSLVNLFLRIKTCSKQSTLLPVPNRMPCLSFTTAGTALLPRPLYFGLLSLDQLRNRTVRTQ